MKAKILKTNSESAMVDIKAAKDTLFAVTKRIGWIVACYDRNNELYIPSPDGYYIEVFQEKSWAWRAVANFKEDCKRNNAEYHSIGLQAVLLED